MKKQTLAVMLALSLAPAAFAQSAATQPPPDQQQQQQRAQHLAEHAHRLAQKLGLDASAAQRFQQTFADFATRRQALHQQLRSANQTLRAAAQGDANAAKQVNATIDQLRSLRSQRVQMQDDLFNQLANGLSDQQKATLVLMLEHGQMGGRFGPHGQGHWQQPAQNP